LAVACEGYAVSIWIRKKDPGGRSFHFAVEVPFGLILPAIGIVVVVLISSVAAAPISTLVVCFAIALSGSALVGVAKWIAARPGSAASFGSTGMPKGMRAIYWIGLSLLIVGSAATLLSIRFVLRH
jgi:hypothetical protein